MLKSETLIELRGQFLDFQYRQNILLAAVNISKCNYFSFWICEKKCHFFWGVRLYLFFRHSNLWWEDRAVTFRLKNCSSSGLVPKRRIVSQYWPRWSSHLEPFSTGGRYMQYLPPVRRATWWEDRAVTLRLKNCSSSGLVPKKADCEPVLAEMVVPPGTL